MTTYNRLFWSPWGDSSPQTSNNHTIVHYIVYISHRSLHILLCLQLWWGENYRATKLCNSLSIAEINVINFIVLKYLCFITQLRNIKSYFTYYIYISIITKIFLKSPFFKNIFFFSFSWVLTHKQRQKILHDHSATKAFPFLWKAI